MKELRTRGFTIVELLIVIVIIGILATITIIAYNGVTSKANTAAAQAAANAAINKLEIYNAENTGYPAASSTLTTATADKDYQLTGVQFMTAAGVNGTAPDDGGSPAKTQPSKIEYNTCTTGTQVRYYDFGQKIWVAVSSSGATGCSFAA